MDRGADHRWDARALGELIPKGLALMHPEQTSRWVTPPLILFTMATNPFIWLLNGAANTTLKLLGARAPSERERVHSPEEIMMLVEQTRETGRLSVQDARMIEGVFEFSEKNARDVITPRTEIVALPADLSLTEAARRVAAVGRSRYPVYSDRSTISSARCTQRTFCAASAPARAPPSKT